MSDTISFISVVAIFVISMAVIYWLKRETEKKLLDIQFKLFEEYSSWRKDDFAQIKKLKTELDFLITGNKTLVDESIKLRDELLHAKHKTKEIQERYSDYYGKAEQLTLKHLSTISELQGKLSGANQEIEQLKAQLKTALHPIHKGDYDLLKKEYDLTTKNMVQWMTKCSTLEAERQVYESATSQLEQWTSRCGQLQLHVNNLLAENESLKLQLTGVSGIRSQTMFDELKKKHAQEIDNQLMLWDQHVRQKDAEITHLKQVLSDTVTKLDERYNSIVQENEKLQKDILSCKNECEFLEGKCKKLQDELEQPS